MKKLIKKLVETYGPSGSEGGIASLIASEIKPYVDKIEIDNMGNLICLKKASRTTNNKRDIKRVMFAAHMDEIGLVVTYIDDNGFLRFGAVGGVRPVILLGERVKFGNGTIGVLGIEKTEDIRDAKFSKMYIDIGANNREEAEKLVQIGSFASYDREFSDLGDKLTSKSMDNRVSCATLIEAAKKTTTPSNDIYFVFTSQEEVGLRGAKVSAFSIDPHIGIACDVTACGDTPNAEHMSVKLGGGAAIKVKDASVICHIGIKNLIVEVARREKIQYQMEVLEWGGTDAGAISLNRSGVPSGAISIPCRYIHSPSEMVDINDVKAAVELIFALTKETFDDI